jgi:hypothetical protein
LRWGGRWFAVIFTRTKIHGAAGYYGGDGMLVNHLRDGVAKQHHILVKGFNLALKFDAVNQVDRHGHMLPAKLIQERVLQELAFVVAHDILRVPVVIGALTITQSVAEKQKFHIHQSQKPTFFLTFCDFKKFASRVDSVFFVKRVVL